ncbi:MAG: hypothetical protein U5N86_05655 [Planctomycetota bacterium]|nr:hypothetical protein [Planctomycetota bacterium]
MLGGAGAVLVVIIIVVVAFGMGGDEGSSPARPLTPLGRKYRHERQQRRYVNHRWRDSRTDSDSDTGAHQDSLRRGRSAAKPSLTTVNYAFNRR